MLKFITEFGPVVAFFVGYKVGGIMEATLYLLGDQYSLNQFSSKCIAYCA